MPAFTFEKIPPQTKRGAAPNANPSNKRAGKRGLIVQMLDRFAEARGKKSLGDERSAIGPDKSTTSDEL